MQYETATATGARRPDFRLPAPSALLERRVGLAVWVLLGGVLLALGNL